MKTKLLIIFFIALQNLSYAKIPDWVKNYGESARFPTQLYVTGFGSSKLTKGIEKNSCIEFAKKHAARVLAEKIFVNIKSTIISLTTENDQQFSQYFNVATETSSTLRIYGLDYLQYSDKKNKIYYALAYASRDNLNEFYKSEEEKLLANIESQFKAGLNFENNNNFNEALKAYFGCQVLFAELSQIQKIQIGINSPFDPSLSEFSTESKQTINRFNKINAAIHRIIYRPINSMRDAAWVLSRSFEEQFSQKNLVISIQPFSYQETNICSHFSGYFQNILKSEIVQTNGWQVNDSLIQFQQISLPRIVRGNSPDKNKENNLVLKGSYWEHGDSLRLFSNLYNKNENKIIASANVFIPQKIITQAQLEIKPKNFDKAYKDFRNFNKNEIVNEGLMLEAWTNKGTENVMFTEGDSMKVYVRVNMPCYIRFIYHLADSRRALLLDSYHIDGSHVNQDYPIPQFDTFICVQPFGVECLQIFAQTKSFDHLATTTKDDIPYLTADLEKIIRLTRGMKRIKPTEILFAEKRITITTLKK